MVSISPWHIVVLLTLFLGANLSMPEMLGIPQHDNPNAELNQWLVGIINAYALRDITLMHE